MPVFWQFFTQETFPSVQESVSLGIPFLLNMVRTMIFIFAMWELNGIVCMELNYLDFDLEEEVEKPTTPTCENLRRRSVNHSEEPATKNVDNCIEYSDTCPEEIKISWLEVPPFIYGSSESHIEGTTSTIRGIFRDILVRAVGVCCKNFAGTIPELRFVKKAPNLKALHNFSVHRAVDVILPVQSDEAKYGGSLPYIKILDSPGVVLIQQRASSHATVRGNSMWNAVLETWPVVVVALSLSVISGICIWLLVCRRKWTLKEHGVFVFNVI